MIAAAGQRVIEADKRLWPLFARTFSQAQFLPEKLDAKADSERQDCDLHLPAGNLLQYFPLTEEEVALKKYPEDDIEAAFACGERSRHAKGYLTPDPALVEQMTQRLSVMTEGFRVVICGRRQVSHWTLDERKRGR